MKERRHFFDKQFNFKLCLKRSTKITWFWKLLCLTYKKIIFEKSPPFYPIIHQFLRLKLFRISFISNSFLMLETNYGIRTIDFVFCSFFKWYKTGYWNYTCGITISAKYFAIWYSSGTFVKPSALKSQELCSCKL